MKKLEFLAFTPGGAGLGEFLVQSLREQGYSCTLQVSKSTADSLQIPAFKSLRDWTEKAFGTSDALIFIGACGIAVRAVAPFVSDKYTDPAVLAVDEAGHFVVPLLSGHAGGANALAGRVADIIEAQAVISTATDVRGKFAVDVWAVENGLIIDGRDAAKHISAALIAGESVSFESDFPTLDDPPDGVLREKGNLGFCVTLDSAKKPFNETLRLFPKIVVLGIGCRKGIGMGKIEEAVSEVLAEANIPMRAVSEVNSIDLKADEEGLIQFCRHRKIKFTTYSAEQLQALEGSFGQSEFVKAVAGVDNVCERAAVVTGGRLILKKQKRDGVTVAAAALPFTVKF